MPATYDAKHLFSRQRVWAVDFDPDSADPVVVDLGQPQGAGLKCIPIAEVKRFAAVLCRSVGTGNVDAFEIIAATNAAGTGSPTVVKAHAAPTVANAVGDNLVLEVDVEQVREVLAAATHVGIRVELATNTDECIVTAIAAGQTYQIPGLTADFIS